MNIESELLNDRSKENIRRLAAYIGSDAKRFAILWKLLRWGEAPLPQRGAWLFENCVPKHPALVKPYLKEMMEYMQEPVPDGVRRSFTKIFSLIDIPEELSGELYDLCIDWVLQEKTSIAVKVYCMTAAVNIAIPYPELREEISLVIRDQMEHHDSAGVRSRGRRLLKQLGN